MKKYRICSMILALQLFIFIFADVCIVFASYSNSETAEAVLRTIGVVDDSISSDAAFITRGQTLMVLTKIFDSADAITDAVQLFGDVDESNAYFSVAYKAVKLGIISYHNSLLLRPDEAINGNEFAKLLINASGYGFMAEKYHYNDSTYSILATELGIYSGKHIPENFVTPNQAYDAIYRLMQKNALISYTTDGKITKYKSSSATILEQQYHIEELSGVLYANVRINLYNSTALRSNELLIMRKDGVSYKIIADGDYNDLIGCRVKIFYTSDNGDNKAVLILNDSELLTVSGENFIELTEDRNLYYYQIEQYDSLNFRKSEKKIKLPLEITILYNDNLVCDEHKVMQNLEKEELIVDDIMLIDNNNDGTYDILNIKQSRNFVIYKNNPDYKTILDKDGESYVFEDRITYNIYDLDGKFIFQQNFKEGAVLSIREGIEEFEFVDIIYSYQPVSAKIKFIQSESGGDVIIGMSLVENTPRGDANTGSMVGGEDNAESIKRYKVANNFKKRIFECNREYWSFYKFCVDKDGKVAGCHVNYLNNNTNAFHSKNDPNGATTYNVANVGVVMGLAQEGALDPDYKIKLYCNAMTTIDPSVLNFKLDKKFKLENILETIPEYDGLDADTIRAYEKIKRDYEQYGNDGKKYSSDQLKLLLGRNLIAFVQEGHDVITKITLPSVKIKDGTLCYATKPGQTYNYSASIFYSTTTSDKAYVPTGMRAFYVPEPTCSYANEYSLCMWQQIGSAVSFPTGQIYKVDFYTFEGNKLLPDIAVKFTDYDLLPTGETYAHLYAKANGVVTEKTLSISEYGGTAVNFYVKPMIATYNYYEVPKGVGSENFFTDRRMQSLYGETVYTVPYRSGQQTEAIHPDYTNLPSGHTYKYIPRENASIIEINEGDIVAFDPVLNVNAVSQGEYFLSATKLYDYNKDSILIGDMFSITDPLLNDAKGYGGGRTNRYMMYKASVYKIDDDMVAFLPEVYAKPEKYFDYTDSPEALEKARNFKYGLNDCRIYLKRNVSVMRITKTKRGFVAENGYFEDLYDANFEYDRILVRGDFEGAVYLYKD